MEKTFQRKGKEKNKERENDIESDEKMEERQQAFHLFFALLSWHTVIKLIQGVLHDLSR